MSPSPIARNRDILALEADGYVVRLVEDRFLVVDGVRYLTKDGAVGTGSLVSELQLAGQTTVAPSDHVIKWSGAYPCDVEGREIEALRHAVGDTLLAPGLTINMTFSARPRDGFHDYHHKMSNYAAIIEAPVNALHPHADRRVGNQLDMDPEASPFVYPDTASVRAGIVPLNTKLNEKRVAIVGLGGTGSYVLDLLAKSPVEELHLFDGDHFENHNAFRAPGAASLADLSGHPLKVEYLAGVYGKMRRGITGHPVFLDRMNLNLLDGMDMVFICVDPGETRILVARYLEDRGTPFIDVGMGVTLVDDSLLGVIRVTTSSERYAVLETRPGRLPAATAVAEGEYEGGIQLAELNSLAASLAVLRWKRMIGFYHSDDDEHNSTYISAGNEMIREDYPETATHS
jgi:hypothetical protein